MYLFSSAKVAKIERSASQSTLQLQSRLTHPTGIPAHTVNCFHRTIYWGSGRLGNSSLRTSEAHDSDGLSSILLKGKRAGLLRELQVMYSQVWYSQTCEDRFSFPCLRKARA